MRSKGLDSLSHALAALVWQLYGAKNWASRKEGIRVDIYLLSIYTFCFLRKSALISCTLAAKPRWTFLAASTA
jgi:hypothetical protein